MVEKPYIRIARFVFFACAWLFTGFVVLQIFLAGLALFVDSSNWLAHASLARYFAFLPLLMIVLAWIARLPMEMLWRSIGLVVMVVCMFLTAILSARIGILSALHPVIAAVLFLNSTAIIRGAGTRRRLLPSRLTTGR